MGFEILLVCIFDRYSPKTPSVSNWTPEKIEIIDAKNGKPGTGLEKNRDLIKTYNNNPNPNTEKANPE